MSARETEIDEETRVRKGEVADSAKKVLRMGWGISFSQEEKLMGMRSGEGQWIRSLRGHWENVAVYSYGFEANFQGLSWDKEEVEAESIESKRFPKEKKERDEIVAKSCDKTFIWFGICVDKWVGVGWEWGWDKPWLKSSQRIWEKVGLRVYKEGVCL